MAAGATTYNGNGDARNVDLLYTVTKNQVAVVGGQVGIMSNSGGSGDTVAMDVADDIRVIELPAALNASAGDKIFITVATVTGHTPDDAAYTTSAGAGKILLGILITDQDTNDLARIMRVGKGVVAS
jgi:hypothetical protein